MYLRGHVSKMSPCLKLWGRSREHKSIEKSTVWVWTCFSSTFDLLFLHKYTCDGSGYETECVLDTCVDLIPGYLYIYSQWEEVESIQSSKSRLSVYNQAFLRRVTSHFFTNTHWKVVVGRQIACGVSVWTSVQRISMFAAGWGKLRTWKQRKVYTCV